MGALNDGLSWTASILEGGRGLKVARRATLPEEHLELFEFEACPFCRKVREVLSELDLPYVCHPCAHGSRNRPRVRELGGKLQFPFLVDPNTDQRLYESEDIITYLHETYGEGRSALSRATAPAQTLPVSPSKRTV